MSIVTLANGIDRSSVRRGTLFLVNIGTPLVAAVSLGQPHAALLGGVSGMLLSFADNDGPLPRRLRLLGVDWACLAAGGMAGYGLRHIAAAFWAVFVILAFTVGFVTRYGREPLLASRNGAMAFTVAVGVPAFGMPEISALLAALLVAATSRSIDHAVFGPLPLLRGSPPPQAASGHWGWTRYALAYAAAATVALWIGVTYEPMRAVWVVTTTLVVMQPDARASYRRIVERIVGTFLGVLAAWVLTRLGHSAPIICAIVLAVAPLIPHHIADRYWAHTGLIAVLVLLAYDLVNIGAHDIDDLLMERLKDMLLGCVVALLGTAVAFWRPAAAPPPQGDDDGVAE